MFGRAKIARWCANKPRSLARRVVEMGGLQRVVQRQRVGAMIDFGRAVVVRQLGRCAGVVGAAAAAASAGASSSSKSSAASAMAKRFLSHRTTTLRLCAQRGRRMTTTTGDGARAFSATTTTSATASYSFAASGATAAAARGGIRRRWCSHGQQQQQQQRQPRQFSSSASSSSSKVSLESEIPLLATTTFVGVAVASFWRGAWYVLDEVVFPADVFKSGLACFVAGVGGLATSQHAKLLLLRELSCTTKTSHRKRVLMFTPPTYFVALSCVLFWRGVWCLWDSASDAYFGVADGEDDSDNSTRNNNNNNDNNNNSDVREENGEDENVALGLYSSEKFKSGIVSHAAGVTALVSTGFLASAACPPAGLWVARDAATAVRVARLAARR